MTWREQLRAVTWRDLGESVRGLLLRNPGAKLLSLLIAFGLWFFVNAGERDAEMAVQVPVELRNRPPNVMLISPRVDFIDLVVSGPRTLLNRIDPQRISITLDLNGVRPGPAVFRILGETLDLPRGVTVVRLTPSEVTLEFAAVLRKRVPVHVALTGKPPGGLRVTDTRVAPESVEAVGPAEQVGAVKAAETDPIDLAEVTAGLLERDVPLDVPGEYISFSASLAHVQVRLEEPERTRTLAGVPIVVRDGTWRATVAPGSLQLTVRGPQSAVDALELHQGAVYIDAAGREPGNYDVTPAVDLPAGVELVGRIPPR
ncbi:MAG: CdaR family protein [Candidatus Binatia bacterium]